MAKLIQRTSILFFSRLTNVFIATISPVLLVRLLDVHSYGQYREFILYSSLVVHLLGFAIQGNLIYFVAKSPENEKIYITHTAILSFISSLLGIAAILIAKDILLANTSFDFILPLIIYLFFSLNLTFWESYFLAKKQASVVLYYSIILTTARIVLVVSTAYLTRRVEPVIYALIALEMLRFAFVSGFCFYRKWFTVKPSLSVMKEQIRYFAPLGIGEALRYLNQNLGNLLVATYYGVELLALYTIGTYQLPIINILKSSVVDTIFPEIIQKNKISNVAGLELWQKSHVVFCFLSFPTFVVFFYYADIFIATVFTKSYSNATPIFRVMLFILIIRAFEMSVPLRSINKNIYFVMGSVIRLMVNIALIIMLLKPFGFIGPAVALVFSGYSMNLYLAYAVLITYRISIKDLLMWRKVGKISLSTLIPIPILFMGESIITHEVARAITFSIIYASIFLLVSYLFEIEEITFLIDRYRKKIFRVPA